MLLRLAYLTVTNAFAMLRLLPMSDRDKDVLDHREHIQPRPDSVTVSRKSHANKASAWEHKKSAHVLEAAFRCRDDPGLLEDFPDGGGCHLDPQNEQFTVDAAISPTGILLGEPQDQASLTLRSTSTGSRCSNAAKNARSLEVNRTLWLSSWRSSTVT